MLVRNHEGDRARRFGEIALPHLDALYTLARYLTRTAADADDAVQECYLRALRHFDGFHGTEIKAWLMAILRNVCLAEYARRSALVTTDVETDALEQPFPLWQEEQESPEAGVLRRQDADAIRSLVAALPTPFREIIILREIEDLSYREIAQVIEARRDGDVTSGSRPQHVAPRGAVRKTMPRSQGRLVVWSARHEVLRPLRPAWCA